MKISNFKFQINSSSFEKLFFYLTVLFLPTQFGKHFWPSYSFINGIRIDYLSPTVYFTDILIFVLFLTLLINWVKNLKNIQYPMLGIGNYWILVVLVLFLLISVLFSKNISVGLYGLLKFIEFAFFGFYTAWFLKTFKQVQKIITLFAIGIAGESLLAIFQYISQSSLNGLFYFLGERTFTAQTPGIANASLNGELVLRPYGTFSHPNVLAAYLLIGLSLIIFNFQFSIFNQFLNINFKKILLTISLLLGSVALFLTMSRIAIILWILVSVIFFLSSIKNIFKKNIFAICYLLFAIFLVLSPIRYRFSNFNMADDSVTQRQELIAQSFQIAKQNPIMGVGLNNYLTDINPLSDKNTFYLQPVHNIYLLILAQTGIIGFSFFLWFLYRTFKNFSLLTSHFSLLLFSIILVLGMFDHYFLTLQQGQLLLSFIFGLLWSRPCHAELGSASQKVTRSRNKFGMTMALSITTALIFIKFW